MFRFCRCNIACFRDGNLPGFFPSRVGKMIISALALIWAWQLSATHTVLAATFITWQRLLTSRGAYLFINLAVQRTPAVKHLQATDGWLQGTPTLPSMIKAQEARICLGCSGAASPLGGIRHLSGSIIPVLCKVAGQSDLTLHSSQLLPAISFTFRTEGWLA